MSTIVAFQLQQILERCERLACDGAALRRAGGIGASDLADPEARLPWEVALRILVEARRQSGDDLVGLRAGGSARPRGLLPYLAWSHATVKEALEALAIRAQYAADPFHLELAEVAGQLELRVDLEGPQSEGLALAREYAVSFVLAILAELGEDFRASEVRFSHAPRGPLADYARVVGAPVSFHHSGCSIRLSRALLSRALPTANPILARNLAQHIDASVVRERAGAFRASVERVVERSLGESRPPSRGESARRLGVSMRTLQRRLQAEGCSYRELRDGVLSRIAQERLADPGLPITALAEQLGFASASAFGKAFRRWTGSSARAYRQREST